ncbi:MAG: 4Fe-4S dicluster domain-containing protein [Planctomycetes bacterium]|nr:4Fe-4S dicluster domain-containing protein [Planctomycetota bacterium]
MSDPRLDRRALFSLRGLGAALGRAPARPARPLVALLGGAPAPAARALPVLRPPGAVDEADFLARCTRCDDCAAACPHDAIVKAPARLRQAAGTPVIDPVAAPCRMCPDLPCAAACLTGALRPDGPRVMGRAVIAAHDCLAYQGTGCAVCVEQCPVPGALRLDGGRPVVDAGRCTGCGVCQHVCPSPHNAVLVLPALRRGP